MKLLLRTALLATGIGSIGPAHADGGSGPAANTFFTELPGVIAQATTQEHHAYVANKSGSFHGVPAAEQSNNPNRSEGAVRASHGSL